MTWPPAPHQFRPGWKEEVVMRRLGIVIGAAVAVIAFILIIISTRIDVNRYRTQIQIEMEQRLGRQVTIDDLKLKLLPLRLRAQNLAISDDPAFGRTPFMRADTADLSVRLLSLMGGAIEIEKIEMQRPTVELVKSPAGVWNFSTIGRSAQHSATGSGRGVVLKGNLNIRDGQVAVTSLQKKGSRKIYDHIDIAIRDFAPEEPFSIDAVARISSQGGQEIHLKGDVGPLSEVAADRTPFDGTLSLNRVALNGLRNFVDAPLLAKTDGIVSGGAALKTENAKLMAVGSIKMEDLRINDLDAGYPITAQFNLAADPVNDVITIVSSTIALGSAPVDVRGSMNFQPAPAELDLNVRSERASIGEVTRLLSAFGIAFAPDAKVTGQMDADLQIRGAADNPTMNGNVSARDLRIAGKAVPQEVQVASVDLAITPKEIRSNNFEVRSGNTTASARFAMAQYTSKSPSIDFALRSVNANLPDILSMARAYGAQGLEGINGSGTMNLDMRASGPVQSLRSSTIMQRLNGNANMNFNNVRIAGLDVEHELASLGGFKKPVQDRGGTDIERLTGNFVVRNGIAQTNDLRAVLHIGNVAAAGAANLSSHTLNLRATAVLSKAASEDLAGGSVAGVLGPVLANSRGEFVVPGLITGTFEKPKFQPDMEQLTLMRLKGVVPTSDNPFGILGTLFGHNKKETRPPAERPSQGIDRILGGILGGK